MGGRRVVRYGPDGSVSDAVEADGGDRLNGPNDLPFDRQGRPWFTDSDHDQRPPRSTISMTSPSTGVLDPAVVGPGPLTG